MFAHNCHNVQKFCHRIVQSKNLKNRCSSNWRADWARFVGKTYAQVVKVKIDLEGQSKSQSNQVIVKKTVQTQSLGAKTYCHPSQLISEKK